MRRRSSAPTNRSISANEALLDDERLDFPRREAEPLRVLYIDFFLENGTIFVPNKGCCLSRFAWTFLVLLACTSATHQRKVARLYAYKYVPPYSVTTFIFIGNFGIPTSTYYPEAYILYFDVGEEYGVPAYVSRSTYEGARVGANYDITYSNGEGCQNIRHVTNFN